MSKTKGAANFGRRSRKPEWMIEIERVNRLALAVGLSYGRYVAKHGGGKHHGKGKLDGAGQRGCLPL